MITTLTIWLHKVFVANLNWWTFLGIIAQISFTMRFVVQWLASERAKKSVVPVAFWIFSLVGGGLLFIYSLYKEDPVFILGQGVGLLIYIRNLWLIYHEWKSKKASQGT